MQKPLGLGETALILAQGPYEVVHPSDDHRIGDTVLRHDLAREGEELVRLLRVISHPPSVPHVSCRQGIEIEVLRHPWVAIRNLASQIRPLERLGRPLRNAASALLEQQTDQGRTPKASPGTLDPS